MKGLIRSGWPHQESSEAILPYIRRKDELSLLDGSVLWEARIVIPPPGQETVLIGVAA